MRLLNKIFKHTSNKRVTWCAVREIDAVHYEIQEVTFEHNARISGSTRLADIVECRSKKDAQALCVEKNLESITTSFSRIIDRLQTLRR